MSVVLPAPDGPETMNSVPSAWKLLDILHLLADPFDLGFQFYNEGSERRRTRLRSHGVDLAQHLLRKKVELLAGRLAAADRLLDFLDMMGEARQLLGDVGLFDHDDRFLRDPIGADLDARARGNLLYALLVTGDHFLPNLVAMAVELFLQLSNGFESAEDVSLERFPFLPAHLEQFREGLTYDPRQPVAFLIGHLGLDCLYLQ